MTLPRSPLVIFFIDTRIISKNPFLAAPTKYWYDKLLLTYDVKGFNHIGTALK